MPPLLLLRFLELLIIILPLKYKMWTRALSWLEIPKHQKMGRSRSCDFHREVSKFDQVFPPISVFPESRPRHSDKASFYLESFLIRELFCAVKVFSSSRQEFPVNQNCILTDFPKLVILSYSERLRLRPLQWIGVQQIYWLVLAMMPITF